MQTHYFLLLAASLLSSPALQAAQLHTGTFSGKPACSIKIKKTIKKFTPAWKRSAYSFVISTEKFKARSFPTEFWGPKSTVEFVASKSGIVSIRIDESGSEERRSYDLKIRFDRDMRPIDYRIIRNTIFVLPLKETLFECTDLIFN